MRPEAREWRGVVCTKKDYQSGEIQLSIYLGLIRSCCKCQSELGPGKCLLGPPCTVNAIVPSNGAIQQSMSPRGNAIAPIIV